MNYGKLHVILCQCNLWILYICDPVSRSCLKLIVLFFFFVFFFVGDNQLCAVLDLSPKTVAAPQELTLRSRYPSQASPWQKYRRLKDQRSWLPQEAKTEKKKKKKPIKTQYCLAFRSEIWSMMGDTVERVQAFEINTRGA